MPPAQSAKSGPCGPERQTMTDVYASLSDVFQMLAPIGYPELIAWLLGLLPMDIPVLRWVGA